MWLPGKADVTLVQPLLSSCPLCLSSSCLPASPIYTLLPPCLCSNTPFMVLIAFPQSRDPRIDYETCCHCCVHWHQTFTAFKEGSSISDIARPFFWKFTRGLVSTTATGWKSGPVGCCCCYPGRILSPHSSAPRSDQRSPRRRGRKWWRIIRRRRLDCCSTRIYTALLLLLCCSQCNPENCPDSYKMSLHLSMPRLSSVQIQFVFELNINLPCFSSQEEWPIVSSPSQHWLSCWLSDADNGTSDDNDAISKCQQAGFQIPKNHPQNIICTRPRSA